MTRVRNLKLVGDSLMDEYEPGDANCLVKCAIEKRKFWDSEETFDCTCKFYLDAEEDVSYRKDIPVNIVADGGLLLEVCVVWAALIMNKRVTNVFSQSWTRNRTFYLSSKEFDDLECVVLGCLFSPILQILGIASPEYQGNLLRQLVSSVAQVYINKKHHKRNQSTPNWGNDRTANKWVQVNVDIVLQLAMLESSAGQVSPRIEREMNRFSLRVELLAREEKNNCSAEEVQEESCCICWNEYPVNCEVARMPCCHHIYHEDCIVEWLARKPNCPLCRTFIPEEWDWKIRPKMFLNFLL